MKDALPPELDYPCGRVLLPSSWLMAGHPRLAPWTPRPHPGGDPMTPPEDDPRATMRATAEKIPPGPPPPLILPKRRRRWAFALATVFLIGAVVAASLAWGSVFTGHRSPVSGPFPPQPLHVPDVPAYYVALTSADGKILNFSAKPTTAT